MKTREEIETKIKHIIFGYVQTIKDFHRVQANHHAKSIYDLCAEHFAQHDPQEGYEKRWINIYISENGNVTSGHFLYFDKDVAIKHSYNTQKLHATVPVWIPKIETEREKLIRELREIIPAREKVGFDDAHESKLVELLRRAAKALEDAK